MRVTGNTPHTQIQRASESKARPADGRGKAAPSSAGTTAAPVKVSSASKGLAGIKSPETPDAERIERLRALVTSGSLPVDSGAIADAMIREER